MIVRSSAPVRVQFVHPRRVVARSCCGFCVLWGNKLSELLSPSEKSGRSSRPTLCTVVSSFLLLKATSRPQ
ncbi:hypothetical protein OIU79_028791 [Salix purpurea]|uniref:Uncharacterized protein n=1 Tax=Salix purpurea TaxID=77065 RepID=A0A9Q0VXN8_SALPP|nr:hypothetical protein OIU79_028791 [Salix purpurea]